MPGARSLRGLLIGGLAAATAPAQADITISGFFSQRFEVRDGDGGGGDRDDDVGLRSTTDLGLVARGADGRSTWTFAPGLRGVLSSQEGDSVRLLPRFNGSLGVFGETTSFSATLSIVPDFVDETQFEDTGRAERDVLQISISGRLGLSHRATSRDTLSFGLSARGREFVGDPETLSASRSIGVDGSWRRGLSALTGASLSPAVRYFESDAENGADGVTLSLPLGFDTRLDPRTTLTGSLGPSVTTSRRDGRGQETDFGVVGGLNAFFDDGALRWTLGLNQSVDQDSDGDLQNVLSLRGGVGYQINTVSRIGIDGTVGLQTALADEDSGVGGDAGDRRTFSLTPRYSHRLTEDWNLDLSYRFRLSDDDDDGTDVTNAVFLQLSRGLTLLP